MLIPKHTKLNKEETEEVLKKYNISKKQLPKILKTDPAISTLDVEKRDVIKIDRNSPTCGTSVFYRVVTD